MINVSNVRMDFYACSSCLTNNRDDNTNVMSIQIGVTENSTQSVRLCEACAKELAEKIDRHTEGWRSK